MKPPHTATAWIPLALLAAIPMLHAEDPSWKSVENEGRFEARLGDKPFGIWQAKPLSNPKGGDKFAASAFLHQLKTPSGFEWTSIQAPDHLHHFGLWWPWKYIEVDGAKHNTWELQKGNGAHRAVSVETRTEGAGKLEWKFHNRCYIRKPGVEDQAVIVENSIVGISVRNDMEIVDVEIQQKAIDKPVTIANYRYSGFSWRGPLSWNKDNSTMTTSEGKHRDDANGTPARWVVVTGPTPTGTASVLMMSAASILADKTENLRVWDSKNLNGMPFINFNPVTDKALPLDDAHPAVSKRKYRVIAADHAIEAAAAEAEWKMWMADR